MHTNDTNITNRVIYPELSYTLTGMCFDTHNELGRYAKEKQYCDGFEKRLKETGLPYKREFSIGDSGNTVDFLAAEKIILEFKAKRIITREDYYQIQRYLQAANLKLGLLVNFRDKYIKPVRVVRIDTTAKSKYSSNANH